MMIFGVLANFGGKIAIYLRYGLTHIFWLTAATLSGLLFLREPWSEPAIKFGGGALGSLINLVVHLVIFIGPFWLAVLLSFISLLLILSAWSTNDDIKNGNFQVEE